jgi:hypothetical protein
MEMALLVVSIAIAGVIGITIWCGLAAAEVVYGYPVGRHLIRRTMGRLHEREFLSSDIEDLNEAFTRIARSHIVTD